MNPVGSSPERVNFLGLIKIIIVVLQIQLCFTTADAATSYGMKFESIKFNKQILKDSPFLFEKYEVFIIIAGMAITFLIAGFIFYEKAYTVSNVAPQIEVEVTKVNTFLFERTIKELEQRKQMSPDLPIIDPFR